MHVSELQERLEAEAARLPAGQPDARAQVARRVTRHATRVRVGVATTMALVALVFGGVAVIQRSGVQDTTRVRMRAGAAPSSPAPTLLPSPTAQARACVQIGQLKAVVAEGISGGRHWILGVGPISGAASGSLDWLMVAFPPARVTDSCGEKFGATPLAAQGGTPTAFSLGGGGGSQFGAWAVGITTPNVTTMRIDLDNGTTVAVPTMALPAGYPYRAYVMFFGDHGYAAGGGMEHVNLVVALDKQGKEVSRVDTLQSRRCPDGSPFVQLAPGDERLSGQVPAEQPMDAVSHLLHERFPSMENVPRQVFGATPPGWVVLLDSAHRGFFELHRQGSGWIVDHGNVCPG